jgi:hypothetical protein
VGSITTGSGNKHNPASFTMAPNPVTDMLKLAVDQPGLQEYNLDIYDLSGSRVKSLKSSQKVVDIDVSSLLPGTYFVHVIVGDEQFSRKFVKVD